MINKILNKIKSNFLNLVVIFLIPVILVIGANYLQQSTFPEVSNILLDGKKTELKTLNYTLSKDKKNVLVNFEIKQKDKGQKLIYLKTNGCFNYLELNDQVVDFREQKIESERIINPITNQVAGEKCREHKLLLDLNTDKPTNVEVLLGHSYSQDEAKLYLSTSSNDPIFGQQLGLFIISIMWTLIFTCFLFEIVTWDKLLRGIKNLKKTLIETQIYCKNHLGLMVAAFMLPVWLLLLVNTSPPINSFQKFNLQTNNYDSLTFPHREKEPSYRGQYIINTSYNWFTQKNLDLYVDGCLTQLEINKKIISLKDLSGFVVDKEGYCKFDKALHLELPNYAQAGQNIELKLTTRSINNLLTISARPAVKDWLVVFLVILFLGNLYYVSNQLFGKNLQWITISLVVAVLLRLYYIQNTLENVRTYDVFFEGGHFDYIRHLATTWTLPDPTKGWETFQPPLYYTFAALGYTLFQGSIASMYGLQLISLFLNVVCLITGIKIIELTLRDKNLVFWASLLLLFFPTGVIQSVRIGNDIMFYTTYLLAIYFVQRYWKNISGHNLALATIFSALSVISKSNGTIACMILLSTIVLKHIVSLDNWKMIIKPQSIKSLLHKIWIPTLVSFLAFLVNFSRNLYNYFIGVQNDWLVSSVSLIDPSLAAKNDFWTYFGFDFGGFFLQAFTDTRYDSSRLYFWNFLLKTSLFGEFGFDKFVEPEIALGIIFGFGALILILIWLSIRPIPTLFNKLINEPVIWLNLFLLIAGLIFYRFKMPFVSNNDFRYVYPILLSGIILLFLYQKSIWILRITKLITAIFVILSLLFFANLSAENFNLRRDILFKEHKVQTEFYI
jgi:Dolichyl-phosphate-mannose-protein mannosyltransferase